MGHRIAFVAFASAALLSAGALAACPAPLTHAKHHAKKPATVDGCTVNLNGVPQISEHIVATEPAAAPVKPVLREQGETFYTGPTVGVTKPDPGVRPTPTVGYKWSLD